MKSSFLEKLLERAPRVGAVELQTHLTRLAEEKGFLETLFNTLQEGVTVLDGEGKLIYWNRAEWSKRTAAGETVIDPVVMEEAVKIAASSMTTIS